MESPFEPGERIYRTGDVACWNQQGRLLLGGRKDSQIKLRGLRIEPQEIAMCLMAHPQMCIRDRYNLRRGFSNG